MTGVKIHKMSGAGNKFVVLDGRNADMREFRNKERIGELCAKYRTDGLMILDAGREDSGEAKVANGHQCSDYDFRMEFYNPDGSGGMMCGNGGRCIVAFADWLGVKASSPDHYVFLAPDGPHSATIIARPENDRAAVPEEAFGIMSSEDCAQWTVRLKMIDVDGIKPVLGGYFLNTGTRHFVKFVEDVDSIDVEKEGKELRWDEAFAPEGTNVNFVQRLPDGTLKIRTFEKGVEGETLACGTGITAAAIAAWAATDAKGSPKAWAAPDTKAASEVPGLVSATNGHGRISIRLQARRGDMLSVDFVPSESKADSFREIHLTGPAEFV